MWPTMATERPGGWVLIPGTFATVDPTLSWVTSAKAPAASRKTAAGACSYPEGPAAVSSLRRVSGSAMESWEVSDAASVAGHELAQHELQDPAVLVVLALLGRVDAHLGGELDVAGLDLDLVGVAAVEAGDRDLLLAREPERRRRLALGELQRQHAHADQVGAVDALEGLRDHRAHAEQVGALGGPVARGARAVLGAGEHDQRRALLRVLHRRVVDRLLIWDTVATRRELDREAADQ